jgi:hypothetical protein
MRALGSGLMVVGMALALVSIAGMLGAFRGSPAGAAASPAGAVASPAASGAAAASGTITPSAATATPSAHGSLPSSAGPSSTIAGSPSPSIVHQLVARFVRDLAEAIRTGNAAFLEEHLDPRVRVRYASADCTRYLAGIRQPTYQVEVLGVDGPGPWNWETDGRSEAIPESFTVRVRLTQDGTSFTNAEAHFVIGGGIVRWFTDCGTPVG